MTQAGKISCPSPKTNKCPLCMAESLPKTPFLCFWPKPSKAEKSQNLEEEEGRKERGGGGGSGMCRGGGGNKSLHYKKKVQSSFHFFFSTNLREHFVRFAYNFCALQILILAMPRTREEVAS